MHRERMRIAVVFVQIPGDQSECAVPSRSVAPLVSPAAAWYYARQLARWPLLVSEVVDPFLVKADAIEVEQALLGREMRIAGPAVLFSMRAICRDALQVAKIRPPRILPDMVQQRIGAFEFTNRFDGRVHEFALKT